jgi:hypothetical protein
MRVEYLNGGSDGISDKQKKARVDEWKNEGKQSHRWTSRRIISIAMNEWFQSLCGHLQVFVWFVEAGDRIRTPLQ